LAELSALLNRTFPDPNSVLGLDRMQEFLAEHRTHRARRFHVLLAQEQEQVVGGTIFSYVLNSNCGFSEYIVVAGSLRGRGLGRTLFNARRALLNVDAAEQGQPSCSGLFIEADSPRRTPASLATIERETALDTRERLRLFEHLGFKRVEVPYVQPPLAAGKQAVDYMDLLFAPWPADMGAIPTGLVLDTVEAIWSAWTPATFQLYLKSLQQALAGIREVPLTRLGGS
jgi:GNAT superfamily N-acetyltransferase